MVVTVWRRTRKGVRLDSFSADSYVSVRAIVGLFWVVCFLCVVTRVVTSRSLYLLGDQ